MKLCIRCNGTTVVGRHPKLPPLTCPRCDGTGIEEEEMTEEERRIAGEEGYYV